MAGDYVHYQTTYGAKIGNANILVDTAALTGVLAPSSSAHQLYIQKVTLSITTHFATALVQIRGDLAGSLQMRHTDAAAAAMVPSVVTWDFGPQGSPLTVGEGLEITVTNPGLVGIVHIEAYEKVQGVIPGTFDPTDLGGLAAWWASNSLVFSDVAGTTAAAADETVKCWTDKVNGWRATEATTPPTLKANIQNGRPVVRFALTASSLLSVEAASYGILRKAPGATVVMACIPRLLSGVTAQTLMNISTSTTTNARHSNICNLTNNGSVVLATRRLDADSATTVASAAAAVAVDAADIRASVMDYANALMSLYVNGAAVVSPQAHGTAGHTEDTDSARFRIGANIADTPGQYATHDFLEIIIYRRALSTTERRQVELYLARKYNIAVP